MTARIRFVAAAMGAALALAGGPARADEAMRVAVIGAGTDGDALASVVASRLTPPVTPADPDAFRAALGAAALRTLAVATKRRDKDVELVARMRAAARSSHADRAVVIHVDKAKSRTLVHVWLVDAQGSGSALVDDDSHLGGGASLGDEADAAWNAVSSALAPPPEEPAAASPAEAAPAAATGPAVDLSGPRPSDADTGASSAAPARPHDPTRAASMAVLGAALQGGSRHFSYVDRLTPTLRPYDLFVAPLAAIGGEIYPFVRSSIPVVNGLGATASYARAFGLASEDSGGARVSTSWQTFAVGLRERLPLGRAFILGVDAGYGDTNFAFDNPNPQAEQLPSVHYKLLRAGLDGRYVHGDLSVHGGASYLDVLSTGDFAALFPHATLGGVEASLGVADQIAPAIELSLDLVYTRFFYDLSPVPGDAHVAGGALDEMATVSLGIAYLF